MRCPRSEGWTKQRPKFVFFKEKSEVAFKTESLAYLPVFVNMKQLINVTTNLVLTSNQLSCNHDCCDEVCCNSCYDKAGHIGILLRIWCLTWNDTKHLNQKCNSTWLIWHCPSYKQKRWHFRAKTTVHWWSTHGAGHIPLCGIFYVSLLKKAWNAIFSHDHKKVSIF